MSTQHCCPTGCWKPWPLQSGKKAIFREELRTHRSQMDDTKLHPKDLEAINWYRTVGGCAEQPEDISGTGQRSYKKVTYLRISLTKGKKNFPKETQKERPTS